MNLFEAGALLTQNTGKDYSQTPLSLAREKEIAVMVNRPLNAIPGKGGGMIRLADPQAEISNTNFEAQQPKVAALEHDYKQVLGPNIPQPDKGASPLDYLGQDMPPRKARGRMWQTCWQVLEPHDHLRMAIRH